MVLAEAEHFVRAPNWTWYILFYFFLAGLSGGSYVLATLLRLRGDSAQEAVARLGYYVAFPTMLVCPILLTLDLGQPLRFWHMLVNTTPGQLAPIFKWPAWVEDISPFRLYGQPLSSGVDGVGLTIMIAVAVFGFVGSALLLERRDVGA